MSEYRVLDKLGQGAMGIVYRAVQEPLGRQVALKVIQGDALKDATALKRFEREVDACIKLSHPNIVKILDFGIENGQHYYVMELIEDAITLESYLQAAPLKIDTAVHLMDQLLDALDACHKLGFIHRDVKPANIMVEKGDHVILMDFGLVKPVERTVITEDGSIVGTPRYTAPEILKGAGPSYASDLFAVGAIFYQMLTGHFAFSGSTISEVVTALLRVDPEPVSVNRSDVPEGTDLLLCRFLAKNPAQRFASAAQAREAVLEWKNSPRPRRSGVHDRRSMRIDARSTARLSAATPAPTPTPLGIKVALFAGAAVFLIGMGSVAWRLGTRPADLADRPGSGAPPRAGGTSIRTGPADVAEVDVWWGATCAEVSWVSQGAYAARAEVTQDGGGRSLSGGEGGAPVFAQEPGAVTRHALRIVGLRPGCSSVMRVTASGGGGRSSNARASRPGPRRRSMRRWPRFAPWTSATSCSGCARIESRRHNSWSPGVPRHRPG